MSRNPALEPGCPDDVAMDAIETPIGAPNGMVAGRGVTLLDGEAAQ